MCVGAQFYCLVQPKSILLPGRDDVRGVGFCRYSRGYVSAEAYSPASAGVPFAR